VGGGNSHQRRMAKKERERLAVRVPPTPPTETKYIAPLPSKLWRIAESAVTWGAVSMLLLAIGSASSSIILFILAWFLLTATLLKEKLFEGKRASLQALGNASLCMLLAVGLVMVWKKLPQPKELPTEDSIASTVLKHLPSWVKAPNPPPSPPATMVLSKDRGYVDIWPKQVGVNATPNTPDTGRLTVNIECENVGTGSVVLNSCDAAVDIYEGKGADFIKDRKVQEEYFQSFLRGPKSHESFPKKEMPGGSSIQGFFGPLLTEGFRRAIDNEQEAIVVVGRTSYDDGIKTRSTDLCEWMSPPLFVDHAIWHRCLVHEGE